MDIDDATLSKFKELMKLSKFYTNCFSDDPDTKVGALFVNKDYQILSAGFNHSPSKMDLRANRVNNFKKISKPQKYDWIEHAERNAIFSALNHGTDLTNSVCITTLPPCIDCTRAIILSNVSRIITFVPKGENKWSKQFETSKLLLNKSNIPYHIIDITEEDTNINIGSYGWTRKDLLGIPNTEVKNTTGGSKKLKINLNKTRKQNK